VTAPMLAQMICLASGIFGRPAWDAGKCAEHAGYVLEAAARHHQDPVLMVAHNVVECDMNDRDNPVYAVVRGRKKLVGYDACPMGVRIMGAARRADFGPRELYEAAARKLEKWERWCKKKHRGQGHHFVRHYNEGNPAYADQVLGVRATLLGRSAGRYVLVPRITEIVRRLSKVFVPGWWQPNT
jgi:hypothetical protein